MTCVKIGKDYTDNTDNTKEEVVLNTRIIDKIDTNEEDREEMLKIATGLKIDFKLNDATFRPDHQIHCLKSRISFPENVFEKQ